MTIPCVFRWVTRHVLLICCSQSCKDKLNNKCRSVFNRPQLRRRSRINCVGLSVAKAMTNSRNGSAPQQQQRGEKKEKTVKESDKKREKRAKAKKERHEIFSTAPSFAKLLQLSCYPLQHHRLCRGINGKTPKLVMSFCAKPLVITMPSVAIH